MIADTQVSNWLMLSTIRALPFYVKIEENNPCGNDCRLCGRVCDLTKGPLQLRLEVEVSSWRRGERLLPGMVDPSSTCAEHPNTTP